MDKNAKHYGYGHDFGNSETCGVLAWQNGKNDLMFPSVYSDGSMLAVQEAAHGAMKDVGDYLGPDDYILEYTQGTTLVQKYIGKKAISDGKEKNTLSSTNRYWTNNYSLEALMVGSGSCTREKEYLLTVVTGLPIQLFSATNAEKVKAALLGEHGFTLNGVDRRMKIVEVGVVREGAGALNAYGQKTGVQGIIDIGGETTDLYLAEGMKPKELYCKGQNVGVAEAAIRFNVTFKAQFGYELKHSQASQLLREYVTNGTLVSTTRDNRGDAIPVARLCELIENALISTGKDITTFIQQTWKGELRVIDRAYIVGGGAYYFSKYISTAEGMKFIEKADFPGMGNALGYAFFAKAMMARSKKEMAVA
ncbi:MAG TPA: ParM/StbA family protein [Ktedonobacteraceae bacterium]|nr:ParM/StbA family protein [Ktedonobacteraceae bacterium]